MKLSEQTLKILKNFASINPSILFHPGNLLTTKSISGVIVAEAQIEEEFPLEFALYDLVEFLNTLKLFKSPLLDFGEAENNYMYICEEDNLDFRVRYTFTSKECIKYPERRPVMGNVDISFEMDTGTLDSIMKASTVMQLPNMVIVPGKEGYIDLSVSDAKDRSSNKFSVTMKGDGPVDRDYKLIFKMENFKMLSYDYDVSICGKDVSSFESDVIDYYIALELTSRW